MARLLRLPLFPLGLVLYPGERLPLHIFEPRYKEMVGYCLETTSPFGVVLVSEDHMEEVGCTAQVDRILKRYDDGRLDIVAVGKTRFRVQAIYENQAFLQADVELLQEPDEHPEFALRERAITQHMKLLELAGRTMRPSIYQDVSFVSYVLAQNAGLQVEQQQEVLEMTSERDRILFLIQHFETLIPQVEHIETVRRRIRSNGHFKHFPPEVGE